MQAEIEALMQNNREWAARVTAQDPDFFARLQSQQAPQYLWIGCSDSRVPANQIVGLAPGEVFVHRNVANVVSHTDFNCLAVLQYAVDVLKVRHILVVGHYGCGGVAAAHDGLRLGLVDNWLENVRVVYRKHGQSFHGLSDREQRLNRLCELNVLEQVGNLARTSIVQGAWARGQELSLHAMIYSLANGQITPLASPYQAAGVTPEQAATR